MSGEKHLNETRDIRFPVFTANFAPLRFVLRDADTWAPTIEEINGQTYNHIRLHRLSTFLDVGLRPFSMGICFDGTLILPKVANVPDARTALSVFNRLLSELLVGGLYCEAVLPEDISDGTINLESYTMILHGGGPNVSFHVAARNLCLGAMEAIRMLEPEMVTVTELDRAWEKGKSLLAPIDSLPREPLLWGTTFFVKEQWAEALIHLWTTTERLVQITWHQLVISSAQEEKKRKAFLEDNRTWPVSTKLEVLFQKGVLPASLRTKLDLVRQARNLFAHEGHVPNCSIVTDALSATLELASLCSSNFSKVDQLNHVFDLVTHRARCEIPRPLCEPLAGAKFWMKTAPMPGDPRWGDKPYEVIEELRLQPLPKSVPVRDQKVPR